MSQDLGWGRMTMWLATLAMLTSVGGIAATCQRNVPPGPTLDAGPVDAGAQDASWENPWQDAALPAIDGAPEAGPVDAGPVDAAPEDDCARAEAKLVALNCQTKDGGPLWLTPTSGTHFAVECRRALADSPPRDWRPDCIGRITKCANVDVAKRTPKGKPCPSSL